MAAASQTAVLSSQHAQLHASHRLDSCISPRPHCALAAKSLSLFSSSTAVAVAGPVRACRKQLISLQRMRPGDSWQLRGATSGRHGVIPRATGGSEGKAAVAEEKGGKVGLKGDEQGEEVVVVGEDEEVEEGESTLTFSFEEKSGREKSIEEEIMEMAAAALQEVKRTAEEKIEALDAENKSLLARIAELEAALSAANAAKGVAVPIPATAAVAAPAAPAAATSAAARGAQEIRWPSPAEEPPFWTRSPFGGAAPVAGGGGEVRVKDFVGGEKIHVVHVTAEMAPLAKVGGLGDVVTGLGRACLSRGHRVEVILPFYESLDASAIDNLSMIRTFGSYFKGDWVGVQAHEGRIAGVPVILLRPDNHFFSGPRIYGGSYNELEAYLFFSRAALEFMQLTGAQPDIIHVHEWHTAAVAMLYWDMYHELNLKKPRITLTIHNMEHHGECRWEQLDLCGLDGRSYLTVEKAMDDRTIGHNPERLSLLKGGIVYSNCVTTVSPTYSQETLCGGWLSNTLLKNRQKYFGVLNGIDTEMWDPSSDPLLPAHYSASSPAGKALCKKYVQMGLGLDVSVADGDDVSSGGKRVPLVICVTRLVAQKGIHLIRHAIYRTKDLGGQFILLGSSPDGRVQGDFARIADELKDSGSVRLLLTYSESLAHILFAAADIILVPSMFEPCGLTQMIGMRYGAVPVVRRTGGLADTVFDADDMNNHEKGNGFVFDGISEDALNTALDRALRFYKDRPEWWGDLTKRIMEIDNSWNKAAGEYMKLYDSIRVRWP